MINKDIKNEKAIEARQKTIDAALDTISKTFGRGAIMKIGDSPLEDIPFVSTGIMSIDSILGIGGFPRGRICEVFGPESSGKTTLALHVIAEAQRAGGKVAFVDAEHALDIKYAAALGCNVDDMYLSQPDFGEQALEIVEILTRTSAFDIIVVDSVAALVPRAEIEGDMGDAHIALQARLMSQALRKITAVIHTSNTCLIFINQLRSKIGVMFGPRETTTGGNALKFYASVRIEVRRISTEKDKQGLAVSNKTRVKVVKNKVSPPFREVEVKIVFGSGFSKEYDIIKWAVDYIVITRAGAWYTFGDRRWQGEDAVYQSLKEEPALYDEIKAAIVEKSREANS